MKKPDWNPITYENSEFRRTVFTHGRRVEVSVSPYDIPEAFRIYPADTVASAVLEFKYINNDEETRSLNIGDGVMLHLGKMSGRLYRIEFSVGDEMDRFQQRFREVVQRIDEIAMKSLREDNSDMVRRAISTHARDVELAY